MKDKHEMADEVMRFAGNLAEENGRQVDERFLDTLYSEAYRFFTACEVKTCKAEKVVRP